LAANRLGAFLFAVGVFALAAMPRPGAASGVTHTVTMDGTTFKPASMTIKLGDAVVWTNEDPFPHTATATATTAAPAFDSKPLAPGGRFTFKPTAKGDYPYKCTLHTTMRGTLRVE
jgi:plastocyanin